MAYVDKTTLRENFLEKFRNSVILYERCLTEYGLGYSLSISLESLCFDNSSLYQKDSAAQGTRINFLYDSKTPLSYKVLRYVFAEDETYFREFYKGPKERELAKSLEIICETIKLPKH